MRYEWKYVYGGCEGFVSRLNADELGEVLQPQGGQGEGINHT